jgi:restriction system protein
MTCVIEGATTSAAVWLIRAGRRGRYATDFVDAGIIAIGWGAVGDLAGRDRNDLVRGVRDQYGDDKAAPGIGGMLYRFANEIQISDWILTPDSETRELHAGRVIGGYEFRTEPLVEDFPHTHTVSWERVFSRDELSKRLLYQLGSLLTVSKPSAQDTLRAFLGGASISETDGSGPVADVAESEDDPTSTIELYEDLRARTAELIARQVADLDGYETQDLFAGILRTMGYYTQVAPEGKDGGVDILASKDALGVEPPILKVQVKARPTTRSSPNDIRALAGLVTPPDERGIFVSTGGFTRDAETDARVVRINTVGMDRLVELLLETYERLDQDTRSLVPLRRLYVP